jgi:hypothetical protein
LARPSCWTAAVRSDVGREGTTALFDGVEANRKYPYPSWAKRGKVRWAWAGWESTMYERRVEMPVVDRDGLEEWHTRIGTDRTMAERADTGLRSITAPMDGEGRRFDLHALPTTLGSWLDAAAVPTSVARRITGHATEVVLRKHCQRATAEQTRRAVEALSLPGLAATGADGAATSSPTSRSAKPCGPVQRGAPNGPHPRARDHNM